MSIVLPGRVMQTPSAQQFLEAVVSDLATRRSVFVLLPAYVDSGEFSQALESKLSARDFHSENVWLPDLALETPPVAALGTALQVTWPSPTAARTVANLVAAPGLPDIICLDGLEGLPKETRAAWVAFVQHWAQASQNSADRGMTLPALCAVLSGAMILEQIPESNVYLSVRWWWGFPSTLELQLLCRLGNANGELGPASRWREHVLPSLAGNDISLVEYLWDKAHLDFDRLMSCLRSFGEKHAWTASFLRDCGGEEFILNTNGNNGNADSSVSLVISNRALWAHGALCWTPEYGLELHSGALAILGRGEDLKHRLWRGQANLLLPLIDSIRLSLCTHFSLRYGKDWPVRWRQPNSPEETLALQESPLSCQWGYLEGLIKNCPHFRSERRFLSLVAVMREVRNELAHYRPIMLHDFEGIVQEVRRVQREMKMSFPY